MKWALLFLLCMRVRKPRRREAESVAQGGTVRKGRVGSKPERVSFRIHTEPLRWAALQRCPRSDEKAVQTVYKHTLLLWRRVRLLGGGVAGGRGEQGRNGS